MATIQERLALMRSRARVSFESVASHSAKYRPDVDGLRAIAVLVVVFYHLGLRNFRNGLVGVDVFYVISGYLITSLLLKDLEAGRFSIVSFYERRMRRIFPALFVVLLFCTVCAFILLDPPELEKFGKELLSTTSFASNFYFWHSAEPLGYFDTGVISVPLLLSDRRGAVLSLFSDHSLPALSIREEVDRRVAPLSQRGVIRAESLGNAAQTGSSFLLDHASSLGTARRGAAGIEGYPPSS
jgi:hypothetical protein